jgi:hypothetical protein
MSDKPSALRIPNASNPFRGDKTGGRHLTSEDIARHLAAFQNTGGTVEVLGTTRTLRQIGATVAESPAVATARGKGAKK